MDREPSFKLSRRLALKTGFPAPDSLSPSRFSSVLLSLSCRLHHTKELLLAEVLDPYELVLSVCFHLAVRRFLGVPV